MKQEVSSCVWLLNLEFIWDEPILNVCRPKRKFHCLSRLSAQPEVMMRVVELYGGALFKVGFQRDAWNIYIYIWWFPKVVVPNNHGFSYKSDHFGVFWGYHHLSKHPYISLKINMVHLKTTQLKRKIILNQASIIGFHVSPVCISILTGELIRGSLTSIRIPSSYRYSCHWSI